jgi:rod shape determining protein RodA
MTTRAYAAARRTLSFRDKLFDVNWGLVMLITMIACVGFAMLYSVAGGSFHPWAAPQMVRFVIGIVILVGVATVDIRFWMSAAYPAYGVSLLLLLATTIMGKVGGLGAQRWLELGPLQIQPSELMKIALVLALARFLHGEAVEDLSKPQRLIIPVAMIGIPAVLVLMQPNLGTATILAADGASLLFLAGLSWWWILPTLGAGVAADALGAGWNISQAEIAVGSGGLAGKGFMQGTQSRLNFLPEKFTDFIWTVLGEEFGFAGCMAVLLLFAAVIYYGVRIAISSRSQFGRLLAFGIVLNFFFYILINACMVMGLIPVVGIPMPLISYGGTAMLTVLFGFGLLMSVHVHRQVEIPRKAGGLI